MNRQRELRKQNRILVRQEAIAERDLIKAMDVGAEIAKRFTPGAIDATLAIVDERQSVIADTLRRRLQQTALIFGERELDRFTDTIPKSYHGLERKDFLEVFRSKIADWVNLHALQRAVTVTGTLREAVRDILEAAASEGWGEAVMARYIQERVGVVSRANAARIARTEMHTAANVGSDEAARSTGLTIVKEWASAEDGRTRLSHAVADGQTVPMDDPFEVGDAKLMFPGDPSGPGKEIINCRCTTLHHPVIGGEIIR